MMLGGEELWAYDTDSEAWTLYRSDPNPGYRLASQAVFDSQSNEAPRPDPSDSRCDRVIAERQSDC